MSDIQYTALAASPLLSGEVRLAISDKSLTVTALFDAAEIPFAEVNRLALADYAVTVGTDGGEYVFYKLGKWCQPFYEELCAAYNRAVLRALFVKGDPLVRAQGGYRYTEESRSFVPGRSFTGAGPVQLYDNCIVTLPPDIDARRVPLCFAAGLDKGDYELTLTLDTGERYTYAKMGYDTAVFTERMENQIRALREQSLAAVKEIDPSLTAAQASRIIKLMPLGGAAQIGELTAVAPSFTEVLAQKLAATRAAESYQIFRELCDPARIAVGFRKNEAFTAEALAGGDNPLEQLGGLAAGNPLELLNGLTDSANPEETAPPDPYLLWLIAPSPDGQYAAVEFAEADTATFVYRTGGDFDRFAKKLNRALEAVSFRREVIRLSDEELRKPENADYYMAAKRTPALQFVRANFAGRIIHSSADSWKRKLLDIWSGQTAAENRNPPEPAHSAQRFCGQCGAARIADMKFCGNCGAKV